MAQFRTAETRARTLPPTTDSPTYCCLLGNILTSLKGALLNPNSKKVLNLPNLIRDLK